MIRTLAVTIILEGMIGFAYARWREKPLIPLLVTSAVANLITQSLLWVALNVFFRHYLVTLWIAELTLWMMEAVLFFSLRWNRLGIRDAFFLSLAANLFSFGVGWWLPI